MLFKATINQIKKNWNVYVAEGICLALFMISASLFTMLLEHPRSIVHLLIRNDFIRLCLMGLTMGTTASLIIYSGIGKLSGAHMNPAVSLAFLRLGKASRTDVLCYIVAQLFGAVVAIQLIAFVFGDAFRLAPVHYIVTVPAKYGEWQAFSIEAGMSFIMMLVVLVSANHRSLSKFTGIFAGILVAVFLVLSAPISGFSMNPARTLGSAIPSMSFPSIWIYVSAPLIGMLTAAEVYYKSNMKTRCAKLYHVEGHTCIFNCDYCNHKANKTVNR